MIPAELLLQGYRLGVFPMAMEDDSIEWFSPERRGIIPLETFHLPHAARRAWARKSFEVKIDSAFSEVIRACARREETWINEEIVASYEHLHTIGHAHSVEAWQKDKLAGGLYGVAIGGGFFGESMFHRVTDASKIALAALVEQLKRQGFVLLDTQWLTPHLLQFGAIEISRSEYLALLLELVVGRLEVAVDAHGRLAGRVGAGGVVVVERLRLGHAHVLPLLAVLLVRLPGAVRRLVVAHEEERLVLRPVLEESQREVGDQIGAVAGVLLAAVRGDEHGIEVNSL